MPARSRTLTSAFDALPDIARRRSSSTRFAVFLDYDGTLSPIVARPELALLAPLMRDILKRLTASAYVAIVSGRLIEDVTALVDLTDLTYAGSHGFEVTHSDARHETFSAGDDAADVLRGAAVTLTSQLADVPGVHIESKRFAIAVHVRQTPPALRPGVEEAVRRLADVTPGIRLSSGKQVFELRPDIDWHKGSVIGFLRVAQDIPASHTIFIGDDLTDEDAFAVVRDEGFGIVVGERAELPSTAARYALRDVDEVGAWLTALADLLENQPPASLTR